MAQKRELIQFSLQNNTDCDFNVPVFKRNVYSINATTKYSWDIQSIDLSCGTGSIVINGATYPISYTPNSLSSFLAALNNLGFGFFCTELVGGINYLYTQDDTNVYGNINDCGGGSPTTSTTTSTTTAAPTTSTTTSTTTAAPTSTTTTTSTTTAAPTSTTTTTSTTTAAPTSTTTTTSTTTAAPTSTTTTTSTTTAPPTSTTTTTSTTTAAPTTSTTTTTTTAAAGFIIRNTTGSGQIDNVTSTGGTSFYTINTGSFPVTNGNEITGIGFLTASPIFVDITSFTSTSCLSLYINGVLDESQSVSSNGTITFLNKTFTTSDAVLIEYVLGVC